MKIVIEGSTWGEILEQLLQIVLFGQDYDDESPAMPEGQQTLDVSEVPPPQDENDEHPDGPNCVDVDDEVEETQPKPR